MPLKSQRTTSIRQESHEFSSVSTPEILPKFVSLRGAEAFTLVSWQMSRHDMTSLLVTRFLGKCRDMSSTRPRPKSWQMSKGMSRHPRSGQDATARVVMGQTVVATPRQQRRRGGGVADGEGGEHADYRVCRRALARPWTIRGGLAAGVEGAKLTGWHLLAFASSRQADAAEGSAAPGGRGGGVRRRGRLW